jgi:hypothetical protein
MLDEGAARHPGREARHCGSASTLEIDGFTSIASR